MADKDLEKLKKETEAYLNAFQSQKDDILKDYGKKYAEIDKDVQKSSKKLTALNIQLKDIQNEYDSIRSSIPKNKRLAFDIISDAKATAGNIVDDAVIKADEINCDAISARQDALELQKTAAKNSSDANKAITSALDMETKAKSLLSEAESNNEASRKALAKANELKSGSQVKEAQLETSLGNADIREKSLILREKTIEENEKKIEEGFAELRKTQNDIDEQQGELRTLIKETNVELDADRAKIKQAKADNLAMAEGLDARQDDINLQFEHVKNQKEDVERKTRRLEGLKKGIK